MNKNLPVTFTIKDTVDTEDSRFLAITIDVLHTGLNFNGSVFTKDVVDKCAESIKNTPILGYITLNKDGEKDFGEHEYKLITTDDGVRYVYDGNAYGVIPESCDYRWITKKSSDGVEREYFQVDALLWTKFDDAVTIFERDGGKPQSMELQLSSIEGKELDDGTFEFTDFKFEGCCLLSSTDEDIEPAMIDSVALPVFSAETTVAEIKNKLNEYFTIVNAKYSKKEVEKVHKNKNFTLTNQALEEEIRALLAEKMAKNDWGYVYPRYCFVDIQENEVIVLDATDHYRMYGIAFEEKDNKVAIYFDQRKRKVLQYLDLDAEGEEAEQPLEGAISDIVEKLNEQIDKMKALKEVAETNYSKVKADYDEIKPKYDVYVKDAEMREAAAVELAKNAEFEKFDKHLSDNSKYVELKNKRDSYTLEEIQKECAIMFTEKNLDVNFSKATNKGKAMTAGIVSEKKDTEINSRYGVMLTK